MRSMRQLLVKPDCDVMRSLDYGTKSRDTVKNGGDIVQNGGAHMANFKLISQGHLFFKKSFFIKKT